MLLTNPAVTASSPVLKPLSKHRVSFYLETPISMFPRTLGQKKGKKTFFLAFLCLLETFIFKLLFTIYYTFTIYTCKVLYNLQFTHLHISIYTFMHLHISIYTFMHLRICKLQFYTFTIHASTIYTSTSIYTSTCGSIWHIIASAVLHQSRCLC